MKTYKEVLLIIYHVLHCPELKNSVWEIVCGEVEDAH